MVTPSPVTERLAGPSGSSEVTVSVPVTGPEVEGAKVTEMWIEPPGATTLGQVPVTESPSPATVTSEIKRSPVPSLPSVTVCEAELVTST